MPLPLPPVQLDLCGTGNGACNNMQAKYNASRPMCDGGANDVNCHVGSPTLSSNSTTWVANFSYE